MSEVITWKRVPVIGDKAFPTLEEAQKHQLSAIVGIEAAQSIVANKAKLLDILTTDENSRPSARRINGGRKPRKPQPQVDPQAELCKTT